MKNLKIKFYTVMFFLFFGLTCFADPCPPLSGGPCGPPGEEVPINENILILLFFAVALGMYTIYKHKFTTKRPV